MVEILELLGILGRLGATLGSLGHALFFLFVLIPTSVVHEGFQNNSFTPMSPVLPSPGLGYLRFIALYYYVP